MVVNTEPPYFYKPSGKNMHGKPAQEFNTVEGNRLFDCPVAVIFGRECNTVDMQLKVGRQKKESQKINL